MLNYTPGRNLALNLYNDYLEAKPSGVGYARVQKYLYEHNSNSVYTQQIVIADSAFELNDEVYYKISSTISTGNGDRIRVNGFADPDDSCVIRFNCYASDDGIRISTHYCDCGRSTVLERSDPTSIYDPDASGGAVTTTLTTTPKDYYVKWSSRDTGTTIRYKNLIVARLYKFDDGHLYFNNKYTVTLGEELYDYRPAPEDVNTVVCDVSNDSFTI